jgi:mono/diheme cytochrome c family protein
MTKTMWTSVAALAAAVIFGGASAGMQGKTAADVYSDKCAVCHGADGAGKTARGRRLKIKDVRETVGKMTEAQMIEIVTNGKPPDMDAFGKELGADMTKQVTQYYRSLADKK